MQLYMREDFQWKQRMEALTKGSPWIPFLWLFESSVYGQLVYTISTPVKSDEDLPRIEDAVV